MSEMADGQNPVTKADLAAGLGNLETRLKGDLAEQETRLLERIEKTETTLLREFRKWAVSFGSRFRANEVLVSGFSEGVIALEERVGELERRGDT
jgi:hypothetical protein